MGWNYQLVDDNKFSSWHVKLNIPMYKCMYNTIALLQYFEASQIGVLKFPSLNGMTDMSDDPFGSVEALELMSSSFQWKPVETRRQSHQQKKTHVKDLALKYPCWLKKHVLDHHVLMRCLCNTTARSIQVTSKHFKTMFSTQFYSTIPIKVPFAWLFDFIRLYDMRCEFCTAEVLDWI